MTTRSVALLLFAVMGCARATRGTSPQRAEPFCTAPPFGAGAAFSDATQPPSADEVGRRFAGTWSFVIVATEALDAAHAVRKTLRLVRTDSSRRAECPMGRCRNGFSYPASGRFLESNGSFDSAVVAQHRMRDDRDVDVQYEGRRGKATITVGPPAFDAGELYDVTTFSDSAFEGRWESGGYAILLVERAGVLVGERPAGYFCARRLSR